MQGRVRVCVSECYYSVTDRSGAVNSPLPETASKHFRLDPVKSRVSVKHQ